jgi:hypothetical protein
VVPPRAAVQQAVRNASTFLFCLRVVWATVISRSANRLPRSLWVPNERFRQRTKTRSFCPCR